MKFGWSRRSFLSLLPARRNGRFTDPSTFGFAVWQIKEGEDKIIAERLVEILSEAPKPS